MKLAASPVAIEPEVIVGIVAAAVVPSARLGVESAGHRDGTKAMMPVVLATKVTA